MLYAQASLGSTNYLALWSSVVVNELSIILGCCHMVKRSVKTQPGHGQHFLLVTHAEGVPRKMFLIACYCLYWKVHRLCCCHQHQHCQPLLKSRTLFLCPSSWTRKLVVSHDIQAFSARWGLLRHPGKLLTGSLCLQCAIKVINPP